MKQLLTFLFALLSLASYGQGSINTERDEWKPIRDVKSNMLVVITDASTQMPAVTNGRLISLSQLSIDTLSHRCKVCIKMGLKSKLFVGSQTMTAAYCPGYYDENGKWIQFNCNTLTTEYRCSNGHHTYTEKKR